MDPCERELGLSFSEGQHSAAQPYPISVLPNQVGSDTNFPGYSEKLTKILARSLDPTRSINDNCGWEHVLTDLTTYHDYADGDALAITSASLDKILGPKAGRNMFSKPIEGDSGADHLAGAPVMCTEFGGVNIVPAKAGAEGDREWGYTTASDSEDLLKRVEKLVKAVVTGGQACAFVYTQL
jgi:hypothetical protein